MTDWLELDVIGISNEELEQRVASELARPPIQKTEMQKPDTEKYRQTETGYQTGKRVTLSELTRLDDGPFVAATLRTLLQREPDCAECTAWLDRLRSGELGKTELVSLVRQSCEGREAGVHVSGLWPRALLWQACRLPLLGPIFKLGLSVVMLPVFLKRLRSLETLGRERTALLQNLQLQVDELKLNAGIGLDLNAFYALFEQAARGSREEIRKRQSVYLPYAEQAALAAGCRKVLDIGSGRGEWLELLYEADFDVCGAELNSIFAEDCRARGLTVNEQDGITMLRALPAESLCLVTAFHLAEHLPFARLLQLIQEALRVLVPGGCLILETPNPSSLAVGSCSFYSDPTHQRPLVQTTLSFILLSQGFPKREILTLHPHDSQIPYTPDDPLEPLLARWNTGQDYSVIAWKPSDTL